MHNFVLHRYQIVSSKFIIINLLENPSVSVFTEIFPNKHQIQRKNGNVECRNASPAAPFSTDSISFAYNMYHAFTTILSII